MLKTIDFLGNDPQLYIFQMSRYKTYIGGFFSLISIITIFILSAYFSILVFSREQLTLISSQTNIFERKLDLNNVPLLFILSRTYGGSYSSKIIYPIFQLWTYTGKGRANMTVTTIPYNNCTQSDIIGYEDYFTDFNNLENYMCLNKSGLNLTLSGANGDINNGYSKLHVSIAKCTNDSIYNPNDDSESCLDSSRIDSILSNRSMHLYMVYPDKY
jgi:hypothetical protein